MFIVELDRDRIMSVRGKRNSMFVLDWFLRFLGVECKLGVVIKAGGTLVSTEWERLVGKRMKVMVLLCIVGIGTLNKAPCDGLPVSGSNLAHVLRKCIGDSVVVATIIVLVECVLSSGGVCVMIPFNVLCRL